MQCAQVLEKLTLAAEGDLPSNEMLVIRAHLAECKTCGEAYRDVTRLARELRSLPAPQPPPGLRTRIHWALHAVREQERREGVRSPWEVVGPYLAAAAVVAIAFAVAVVVSRPRVRERVALSPPTTTEALEISADQPAVSEKNALEARKSESSRTSADDQKTSAAVEAANRRIRELQEREAQRSRDEQALRPWGDPFTGEPFGTRPDTFAVPTGEETVTPPPTVPTQIEVSFRPPEEPTVGTTVYGIVELSARDTIPWVIVTASGDAGLTIEKPNGTIYSGPVRAGDTTRVPVPMTASEEGLHEVHIKVEADAPGANTDLKAFIPNFRRISGEVEPGPVTSPADKPVHLVFKNATVRQALLDIARQGGLRIEMAEGLGSERISHDVRGVPAKAALRTVAEEAGYNVEEIGDVFRITRP